MRFRNSFIALVVAVGLLVSASVASAATSPVQQGYSTTAGVVQTQVNSPKEQASSELPFTGLDVGLVGAAGAMLLAAGFGIRRLSRSSTEAV
jgi:hypothetical protein